MFGNKLSVFFNAATGGTEYAPGAFSPTPDQIDYLIGQITGGVGREAMKLQQSVTAQFTGEELSWNKVPLAGRFYSDAGDKSAVSTKFYDNIKQLGVHLSEMDGRRKDGLPTREYKQANPDAQLARKADGVLNEVGELRSRRRHFLEKGDAAKVKDYELRIRRTMEDFNKEAAKMRATAP
jgi:hypothetical protein